MGRTTQAGRPIPRARRPGLPPPPTTTARPGRVGELAAPQTAAVKRRRPSCSCAANRFFWIVERRTVLTSKGGLAARCVAGRWTMAKLQGGAARWAAAYTT